MAGVQTCALPIRSEEHTSELQSHLNLVCRLLLEKEKKDPAPPWSPCAASRRIHIRPISASHSRLTLARPPHLLPSLTHFSRRHWPPCLPPLVRTRNVP